MKAQAHRKEKNNGALRTTSCCSQNSKQDMRTQEDGDFKGSAVVEQEMCHETTFQHGDLFASVCLREEVLLSKLLLVTLPFIERC